MFYCSTFAHLLFFFFFPDVELHFNYDIKDETKQKKIDVVNSAWVFFSPSSSLNSIFLLLLLLRDHKCWLDISLKHRMDIVVRWRIYFGCSVCGYLIEKQQLSNQVFCRTHTSMWSLKPLKQKSEEKKNLKRINLVLSLNLRFLLRHSPKKKKTICVLQRYFTPFLFTIC